MPVSGRAMPWSSHPPPMREAAPSSAKVVLPSVESSKTTSWVSGEAPPPSHSMRSRSGTVKACVAGSLTSRARPPPRHRIDAVEETSDDHAAVGVQQVAFDRPVRHLLKFPIDRAIFIELGDQVAVGAVDRGKGTRHEDASVLPQGDRIHLPVRAGIECGVERSVRVQSRHIQPRRAVHRGEMAFQKNFAIRLQHDPIDPLRTSRGRGVEAHVEVARSGLGTAGKNREETGETEGNQESFHRQLPESCRPHEKNYRKNPKKIPVMNPSLPPTLRKRFLLDP